MHNHKRSHEFERLRGGFLVFYCHYIFLVGSRHLISLALKALRSGFLDYVVGCGGKESSDSDPSNSFDRGTKGIRTVSLSSFDSVEKLSAKLETNGEISSEFWGATERMGHLSCSTACVITSLTGS